MRTILFSCLLLFAGSVTNAQDMTAVIDKLITQPESEAHLTFLAADEMRGRDAGSPELDIAANYLRTWFKIYGLKPAPGTNDFFQPVNLVRQPAPSAGRLILGKDQFNLTENLLVMEGGAARWSGEVVYAGYAMPEDLQKLDVKGKLILAIAGSKDADNINKVITVGREKLSAARNAGAAGLVEMVAGAQVPWPALVNYFNKEKWMLDEPLSSATPWIWIRPKDIRNLSLRESQIIKGELSFQSPGAIRIPGKNVAAIVEGSDPALKNEYVIVTAHYDHVGVDAKGEKQDSIFNGARDNATGTVGLLQAAKLLSQNPPKRSVIFLAVTCEEKGLLGSKWYVKNPLVPLNKTVLNLNSDGVGYNDKTRITSISLGRTNMDDLITRSATAFGFSLGGDPDPREGFYERSDQVSFARAGIPAVKLQPGLARMDDEIFKYYHRPADEVQSLDLAYITRFYKSFAYCVYLLANDARVPMWIPGDKFEPASKELYGR